MDFTSIQSIGAHTKNLKLQTQWNIKKANKNYFEKQNDNKKYAAKNDPLAPYREQLDEMRDSKDVDAETIYAKIGAGKELSPEELDYLAKKDPQSYQKVKEVQSHRKAYERKLKQCRTKEDLQRLKTVYVGQALQAVNSVKNNPAIPDGKKFELIMHEKAKLDAVNDAERKFVESGKYHRLPTDEEREEIIREEKERVEEYIKSDDSTIEEDQKPSEDIEQDGNVNAEIPETEKAETNVNYKKSTVDKTVVNEQARQVYIQMKNTEFELKNKLDSKWGKIDRKA